MLTVVMFVDDTSASQMLSATAAATDNDAVNAVTVHVKQSDYTSDGGVPLERERSVSNYSFDRPYYGKCVRVDSLLYHNNCCCLWKCVLCANQHRLTLTS
jgi:hypothetical protein